MVRNLLNTFISNNYLSSYKMDLQIVKTQTNMGKECLIVDGYTFRRDSILKSGEISLLLLCYKQDSSHTCIIIYNLLILFAMIYTVA